MPLPPTPMPGFCPSGDWEEFAGHCYYFSDHYDGDERINWWAATEKCGQLAGTGLVVSEAETAIL